MLTINSKLQNTTNKTDERSLQNENRYLMVVVEMVVFVLLFFFYYLFSELMTSYKWEKENFYPKNISYISCSHTHTQKREKCREGKFMKNTHVKVMPSFWRHSKRNIFSIRRKYRSNFPLLVTASSRSLRKIVTIFYPI